MKYLVVLALILPTLANAQLRTADGGAAVVDNHGLMWADAVGISLFWGLSGEPTAQDWVAKLNEIDYGGYNDWTLPTGSLNVAPNTTNNQLGELFYTDCGNTVGTVTSFNNPGKNCSAFGALAAASAGGTGGEPGILVSSGTLLPSDGYLTWAVYETLDSQQRSWDQDASYSGIVGQADVIAVRAVPTPAPVSLLLTGLVALTADALMKKRRAVPVDHPQRS
jgi:hypothetical protein